MKAEFELTIDKNGMPYIKFRHHDKDNSIEQKLLKLFVDAAKEKGLALISPSGFADTDGNSWENYEIQIK